MVDGYPLDFSDRHFLSELKLYLNINPKNEQL